MCGTSQKADYFVVKRKTIGKRMATKLKDIKAKLQERMHESTADTLKWLQSVVKGYFLLMSGDGKRGGASASVLAPILDPTH